MHFSVRDFPKEIIKKTSKSDEQGQRKAWHIQSPKNLTQ